MRRIALVLVPALLGIGTVVVARSGDGGPDPGSPTGEASEATIQLAPSGLVVDLARTGADLPVAIGSYAAFHVGVAATNDITRVELWENDAIVAEYDPPNPSTTGGQRIEWSPTTAGPALITARAIDKDGRVGLSNPLWVEVTATPQITMFDEDGVEVPTGPVPVGFAMGTALRDGIHAARSRASSPAQPARSALPTLSVTTTGCEAKLTATGADASSPGRLMLLAVAPNARTLAPAAELDPALSGRQSLTASLGPGTQALIVAEMAAGAVTGWSAPAIVNVGDECAVPGWEGDVALVDGRLQSATGASQAYLYVEHSPSNWTRVPASGTVVRSATGFDFSALLPAVAGPYAIRAWGWDNGRLGLIGSGVYTPPGPSPSGPIADPGSLVVVGPYLPSATLRWIEQPSQPGLPEVLATEGVIDVDPDDGIIGTERFRWSVPYLGVTHAIVQVSLTPLPGKQGPTAVEALYSCVVAGSGGEFEIDFDHETCTSGDQKTATSTKTGQADYGSLVFAGAGIPGFDPKNPVSEVDPLSQLEKQLYNDPESPSNDDPPWIDQRIIRVLPMTSDSWNGAVSNDVKLEIDRTPKAPPGEYAYDIDLRLVSPPRPPDLRYANCWQFTGWKDPVAAKQAYDTELAALQAQQALQKANPKTYGVVLPSSVFQPYYWWTEVAKKINGPICAGCYQVFFTGLVGATVGLGGADCSTSKSFLEDPIGWVGENIAGPIVAIIKEFVNLISNAFAELKSLAVDGLMELTGCTGKWCKSLAEAVVNGALLAIGVPPTLPNFDQLVQGLKGDLVDLAVDLAKSAGVPCDEVGSVASMTDQPDLTCEAAVEALIDDVVTAVNQNFADLAASGGITFHPDMKIKPWWAGQIGPAEVEVTVKSTKYTAEEQGKTCKAGVLSSATWTAPSTTQTIPGLGTAVIPKSKWQGQAYEIVMWDLPDMKSTNGYQPVKKNFTLYPPVSYDLATVQVQSTLPLGGTIAIPIKVSPYTFYFHNGATFAFNVGGACARPETHTYQLNGSVYPKLLSVVED